jgi:translocation and assembly module TamB
VTGKSSDNLSRDDTVLVQKAAFALLAGEGESISSKFGLDTLGVATNSGTTKDTVVTVGKQISDRLYVGYERGLKATTGTLQLMYRINSSLNIRAQSGEESAVDRRIRRCFRSSDRDWHANIHHLKY